MTNAIIELITNFVRGSSSTLKGLLNSLFNLVFYFENEIAALYQGSGTAFKFDNIFSVIFDFAIVVLILFFLKKGIESYFLWQQGDSELNPLHLLVRFLKALIVMLCFKYLYSIFTNVFNELLNAILQVLEINGDTLVESLIGNIQGGIFTAVAVLLCLILYLTLIFQFTMKGIEMLILRVSLPIFAIGLINTDGGAFSVLMKKFLQNAFTVVLQLTLVNISVFIVVNGYLVYAIAFSFIAIKTPQLLQEFLVPYGNRGGGIINTLSHAKNLFR